MEIEYAQNVTVYQLILVRGLKAKKKLRLVTEQQLLRSFNASFKMGKSVS